ncbi:hypothetical protein SAMN05660862_0596 [Sphingobacterium psychroaquaticum]|uniref:Uncharacterized protein n=1 Tax=Sphingobacterium psychroaquaticum TaxID=561061 RepID=A0A1X7I9C7_9SPHI|nr:hypothetical protein SAMN05660862_0596 [Sphingobacterium psychroaquaticum]
MNHLNYYQFLDEIKANYFRKNLLFFPHFQNGARSGLIDIFVKLDKKGAVIVDVCGRGRNLQLNDFIEDPYDKLFFNDYFSIETSLISNMVDIHIIIKTTVEN